MAEKVLMPKLGLTMTEGTIEEWKKKEGDEVKKGEILFSVATDKLTNDIEAEADGVLLKILVGEGEDAPCKAVIAWIGAPGEVVPGDGETPAVQATPETETFAPEQAAVSVKAEGGFIPAPLEWVKAVRKICDEHGILMVCDEVQCGWARSGKMFASEYYKEAGCAPDIMTTAKSIAGGIPLSAIVASKEIMDKVNPGTIGGTYGANALAAVSALKVIEVMTRDDFPGKALHIADVLGNGFKEMQKKYPCIGDVRGTGAMMGIEFIKDEKKTPDAEIVGKIVQNAMNKGLMLEAAGTFNNVIRILCPLVATDEQLEAGLKIFEEALAEAAK